jgi:hypothetical protein
MVDDNAFRKYFFNFRLNSVLSLIILMFSSLNCDHVRGRFDSGWIAEDWSLTKGIFEFSLFRSASIKSSLHLVALVSQTLLKEMGRKPWLYCCMNCKLKKDIKLLRGRWPDWVGWRWTGSMAQLLELNWWFEMSWLSGLRWVGSVVLDELAQWFEMSWLIWYEVAQWLDTKFRELVTKIIIFARQP